MTYKPGDIITKPYPPEAAIWCNENTAHLTDNGDGTVTIIDDTPTEAEHKKALLASLSQKQTEVIAKHGDKYMTKAMRAMLRGGCSKTCDKKQATQVAEWVDKIVNENNIITDTTLTLSSALAKGDTTLTVTDASSVAVKDVIDIDEDGGIVTGIAGKVITIDTAFTSAHKTTDTVISTHSVKMTVGNCTAEQIQARIDEISTYEAIFPYLTQADYDANKLKFERN